MDKDIVWQAFYTILGEYAANRPLDYHNYLDLKQIPFDEMLLLFLKYALLAERNVEFSQ